MRCRLRDRMWQIAGAVRTLKGLEGIGEVYVATCRKNVLTTMA